MTHFGVDFGLVSAVCVFSKNHARAAAGARFFRFRGVENGPKMVQNGSENSLRSQGPSKSLWGSSWGPLELKQRWNCEKRCRKPADLKLPGALLGALGGVLGGSWRLLSRLGGSWAALGRLLGRPGGLLGASWCGLGGSRVAFSRNQKKRRQYSVFAGFWASWVTPGWALGGSWAAGNRPWRPLGPSWALLGGS